MKIYHDLINFKARNPVVTIGTFDGVHLGHRMIIERLKELAQKYDGETVIFTFFPHPRLVTAPGETNLRLLTTLEEKKELFEDLGIDHLVVYPFTKEFSQFSYAEFVQQILAGQIKTRCLVVGYDHKFGKNREGGFEYLQECARKYQFDIEKQEPLSLDEKHVSSTKIRDALQSGDIKKANRYLGYPFTLHGKVVEGKQLGRKIGFPTANIEASDPHKIIPGYGVYAVKIDVNEISFSGMLN
ncbi:MAG: riboflavin biosynthesis protein RibF, partial [Bacteroidia bacterium]|nr:riboflavin biosynthesis protein RibF [Bacteroidia bacterium]